MTSVPVEGSTATSVREYILSTMTVSTVDAGRTAFQGFLANGLVRGPDGKSYDVVNSDPWAVADSRATGRVLNGLIFMREWLPWLDKDSDPGELDQILNVVRRWYGLHGRRTRDSIEMAFHDETTAQRLNTLLLLLEPVVELGESSDFDFLVRLMVETSDLLYSDQFHATGNNHGMFQDIALRNYALLATWPDAGLKDKLSRSLERLATYFLSSFTADGVHIENAPTYHLMIARMLGEHLRVLETQERSPGDDSLRSLLSKSANYATHAILPTGRFWPLSDTRPAALTSVRQNPFQSTEFEYAASMGRRGKKPAQATLCLPNSGYFYTRSAWGDANATYIGFVAAYNGHYHKHSDDLSVVVWRDGLPLLSEAGPYGYDYKLPLTKYAYSQFAHNNVTVNGASVARTDKAADTVWMSDAEEGADGTVVRAGTGRLKGTFHQRALTVAADFSGMTVHDSLQSLNENTYDVHWNLAPDLSVIMHANGFEVFRGSEKVADALISSNASMELSEHRGETEPRPMGWSFPDFGREVPATCIRARVNARDAEVTTQFRFAAPFNYIDRGLRGEESGWLVSQTTPRLNYLLDRADSPARTLSVVFTAMGQPGDFSYNYRRSAQAAGGNVLYVLDDFGDQGAYYWLQKMDESPFVATQQLIRQVMSELGILSAEHVATFGSSKGGAAALLHGSALGAGLMVLGAPQFRIGSFLSSPHPNVLTYMARGSTPAHAAWLDGEFESKLRSFDPAGKVGLFVGTTDHHYRGHVIPLQAMLESEGWDVELLIQEGLNHAGVGRPYGTFISDAMTAFEKGRYESLGLTRTKFAVQTTDLVLSFSELSGYRFTVKLFREQTQIDQIVVGGGAQFRWSSLEPGRYRARVYGWFGQVRLRPFTTAWAVIAD